MDYSSSPLGCARQNPPDVACFRGAQCRVEDERLQKRAILGGSATTAMHCYFVAEPRSGGLYTPEEERVFQDVDTTFKGAIISVLADSIVDAYVTRSAN